ncbi:chorismate mutase [archaeon]|jgi:chorismate mutase / prephenate dehydratase|nr:chorismate mutase [archaeon]MBT6824383.1 chorismate mutase [archaeon]MBT7106933.1 chorismate mutase [archaeon]MBT7297486.1 chorismate mutase [archaeon]
MSSQKEIIKLRKKLDLLDNKLSSILTKRIGVANKIATIKKQNNIEKKDLGREKEIITRLQSKTEQSDLIKKIYKIIFNYTRGK